MYRRTFLVGLVAMAAACAQPSSLVTGSDAVQLTKAEAVATFVDIPWHGPSGTFLFRSNGTYTFQLFKESKPRGTWPYKVEEDGTLRGNTTGYTFYKKGDGYRYYHSKSNGFYDAKPNQTAPFE